MRLLVIEKDAKPASCLTHALQAEGCEVDTFDRAGALAQSVVAQYDGIIADSTAPSKYVCRTILTCNGAGGPLVVARHHCDLEAQAM